MIQTGTKKVFKCEICLKTLSGRGNLKQHVENVHKRLKTKCDICGKQFTKKYYLKEHVSGVHEKKRNFKCDQCDEAFFFGSTLSNHKKIHFEKK